MKKQFHMTKSGIQELQAELDSLVSRRGEIADAIKTAREQGDLTENAEYHSAKEEQERTEARISELEHILANTEVISKPRSGKKVQLGSVVKMKSKGGKEKVFQVVGTVEADPLEGKISDESPIGQALLGKAVGDSVDITTPNDTTTYKVTDIS
ncbi:MAG TPA: transcription elongation factor GreA [Candidatus Saccharimonadales bacterium]|nr:transcription elongation factor GreA [Candidatus Saccharimonadales bacterium]